LIFTQRTRHFTKASPPQRIQPEAQLIVGDSKKNHFEQQIKAKSLEKTLSFEVNFMWKRSIIAKK
jgi:hypothetical protein